MKTGLEVLVEEAAGTANDLLFLRHSGEDDFLCSFPWKVELLWDKCVNLLFHIITQVFSFSTDTVLYWWSIMVFPRLPSSFLRHRISFSILYLHVHFSFSHFLVSVSIFFYVCNLSVSLSLLKGRIFSSNSNMRPYSVSVSSGCWSRSWLDNLFHFQFTLQECSAQSSLQVYSHLDYKAREKRCCPFWNSLLAN